MPESLRTALASLLSEKKAGSSITVERLERDLKGYGRSQIIWALKEATENALGQFIVGRRTMPSRFVVGDEVDEKSVAFTDYPDQPMHTFVVRPTPRIELQLPLDLTKKEAERIARWVQSLPIDDLV